MCEVIETIKTKNYVAEIINDEDCYNPRKDYSSLGTLIAFHSRYDLSDNDNWTKEELIEHVAKEDVLSLPVYMYEHSQVSLSTEPFSCSWDSGQVGYIFVSHAEIIDCYGKLDLDTAKKCLETEIDEYGLYLNGEVYGYKVYRKDGEDVDSCWGYIGYDNAVYETNVALACAEENEDEFIDFDKMDNSQKLAFLMERNGYIEDGTGLNEYGHEFRDDNGQALFIDEQENEDENIGRGKKSN